MDIQQARKLAQNETTAPDKLTELARHEDMKTRQYVASNPNTSAEILLSICFEFPNEVMKNPVIPLLLLENPYLLTCKTSLDLNELWDRIPGVGELRYDFKNAIANKIVFMECPECKSTHINKNGKKRGRQNYICVNCQRQFLDCYQTQRGYSDKFKRECLTMYVNGMGFRAIARVKGIDHVTVMNWVKQVGELLPNVYDPENTPQVGELDELETFVGSKKTLKD